MVQVGNERVALKIDLDPVNQAFIRNDISFLDFVTSKNVS